MTVIIALSPLFMHAQCNQQWQHQNIREGLNDIEAINNNTAVAVGKNGTIVKTYNQGETWVYQNTPTSKELLSVRFVGISEGWATGRDGTILRTTDGGNTWTDLNQNVTTYDIMDVHFTDADTGWAVCEWAQILYTTDGGNSWTSQQQNTPAQVNDTLKSVHFTDANTGWAAGLDGTILYTADGGSNWTPQASGTTNDLLAIHASADDTVWAAGATGVLLRKTNGNSWKTKSSCTPFDIRALDFANGQTGWAAAENSTICNTIDGNSWNEQAQSIGISNNLHGVDFATTNHGWAVGNGGAILHTADGGNQWEIQSTGVTDHLNSVFFLNENEGWIVGNNGVVLHTNDGGISWDSQGGNTTGGWNLQDVHITNASTGWIVGDYNSQGYGRIWSTQNGGTYWSVDTMIYANLNSVHFINANNGWVVGNEVLLSTNNSGGNWINSSATGFDIRSVYFTTTDSGWIASDGGVFYSNDGNTFYQSLSSNDIKTSIYFVNSYKGWVVSNTGKISTSPDGGATWVSLTSPTNSALYSVYFPHPDTGWTVGALEDSILYTTDAGSTWDIQQSGTQQPLNSVHATGTNTAWAVGNNGTILKYVPSPSVSADFNYTVSNNTVNLTNTATNASNLTWHLGDGTSTTQTDPSHTYTSGGTYTICLVASNTCGTDSTCKTINVCDGPVSAFSYSTNSLTVNLQDSSSNATGWDWDFDDGSSGNSQNPTYTYSSSGAYTICLEASNNCATDTTCQTITVCNAPSAAFSYTINGLTVDFQDNSSTTTSRDWDFGDGFSSTTQNPTHTYTSGGVYTVCLEASNNCASDTTCQTLSLCDISSSNQSLSFDVPDTVCEGASIQFTNTSTNINGWNFTWQFGGGNQSTQVNPGYTYTNPGTKTVSLEGDSAGCEIGPVQQSFNVRDSSNCPFYGPACASLSVSVSTQDEVCGNANGSATATASSGTSPYNYSWSSGGGGSTISGLSANTYTVTVTDANNCTATQSATISNNQVTINVSPTSSNASGCNASDGTASATASGGAGSYTYSWSNGQSGSSISNLNAGTYTVTATDANGCTGTATATVNAPNAPAVNITKSDISCQGANDGSASASVSGGSTPYNYSWSNGGNGSSISGLPAGNYTVTVTDNSNCSVTGSVTISEPPALSVTTSTSSVTCNSGNDGAATANVTGGTSPYNYTWNTGATGSTLANVNAGTYTVTVSDANNCTVSATATVSQPGGFTISTSPNDADCGQNNGSASVTSPTGNYSYTWSTGQTGQSITNISAGSYTVTVTNTTTNCDQTATVNVGNIGGPAISVDNTTDVSCHSGSDGSATVSATGGAGSYSYVWSDGSQGSQATGLSAGAYSVTVTDQSNCQAITNVTISQPQALQVSFLTTDVSCFSGSDGTATANTTGGMMPYSYTWPNTSSSSATATGLSAGNYTVIITDANGCTTDTTIGIDQPAPLSLSTTSDDVTCPGGNDGSAEVSVTGGTTPYAYNWDNGQSAISNNGLSAGTYGVTITDANNCMDSSSVQVNEPSPLVIDTNNVKNTTNGNSDGAIDISVSGGLSPYNYEWDNGDSSQDITGLSPGSYTVTVTDADTCKKTKTIQVDQNVGISADADDEKGVRIYPNPTSGKVNVDLGTSKQSDFTITVYNIFGEAIVRERANVQRSYETTIDLGDQAGGVYYVRVRSGNDATMTRRVVVSK